MATNSFITSSAYHGPTCTHRDEVYNTICHASIPQSSKLTHLHTLITTPPTTTLHYDPLANDSTDYTGSCTTFETAVARSDHDVVKYLIKAGVNPDICATGMPPLHRAIRNLDSRMVGLLGESGLAHMNIRYEGTTPLKLVARMKVPEEATEQERKVWIEKLTAVKRFVDYFVGRM
jgi:hypothetical protein